MQFLPVKVRLPAPGRTRNAERVEDERKVILETWKQARHSVLPNSFHSPGRRLQILQRLAAHISHRSPTRIVACGELLAPALLPASAVFFIPRITFRIPESPPHAPLAI